MLPVILSLLVFLYILTSSVDVVYSDYIRLVNSYLPDCLAPDRFFRADVLTRIPFTYLMRAVNTVFFGYSVNFDRMLSVLGLFLSSLSVTAWCRRERIPKAFTVSSLLVLFGLSQWEMLLNGSGYPHFLAFSLFNLHFLVIEKMYTGTSSRTERGLNFLLPWAVLLMAGPYLAVYAVVLLLFYALMIGTKNKNVQRLVLFGSAGDVLAVLSLYLLSNSQAVYVYSGAASVPFSVLFRDYRGFSLHFILNGFASALLGGESIERLLQMGILSYSLIYCLGAAVLLLMLLSVVWWARTGLWKESIFPLLFIFYGLGSRAVVFLSRYIFLNETYAWQSRYALQYGTGTIGLILLLGLFSKRCSGFRMEMKRRVVCRLICLLLSLLFAVGALYTDADELRKAPYRKENFVRIRETAMHPEDFTDAELQDIFEYHHEGEILPALKILQSNQLNVYRQQ